MKRKWIFFVAPPALALLIALLGEIVMHLWNWLVPGITGWHSIGFWQALGLLLLCRILFGSWGAGRHSNARRMKAERWERMTPEERERFRHEMRRRCGSFETPIAGAPGPEPSVQP